MLPVLIMSSPSYVGVSIVPYPVPFVRSEGLCAQKNVLTEFKEEIPIMALVELDPVFFTFRAHFRASFDACKLAVDQSRAVQLLDERN